MITTLIGAGILLGGLVLGTCILIDKSNGEVNSKEKEVEETLGEDIKNDTYAFDIRISKSTALDESFTVKILAKDRYEAIEKAADMYPDEHGLLWIMVI